MKISEAIESLQRCLEKFGDVDCKFTTSTDGHPAIEFKNVDTKKNLEQLFPIRNNDHYGLN